MKHLCCVDYVEEITFAFLFCFFRGGGWIWSHKSSMSKEAGEINIILIALPGFKINLSQQIENHPSLIIEWTAKKEK